MNTILSTSVHVCASSVSDMRNDYSEAFTSKELSTLKTDSETEIVFHSGLGHSWTSDNIEYKCSAQSVINISGEDYTAVPYTSRCCEQ